MGHLLADLLIAELTNAYNNGLNKADYLLAVPLAKNRLKERGFNQAELLAKWLSNRLSIPYTSNVLQKVIETTPQQNLSAKAQYKNLKNAFQLTNSTNLVGHHIAIVDDVVTTGSTANALSSLLIRAGASRVDIYALVRTPYTFK